MPSPNVIHVVRPYSSEEEYLAHEAWTIDARGMLLIDEDALPADTAIVFDVQIQGGHKPIRAEAKVVGAVAASGARPGGLRVRFKRFGTATKAFIDRAVAAAQAPPSSSAAPSSSATRASSAAPASSPAPLSAAPVANASMSPAPSAAAPDVTAGAGERREPSGIHRRVAAPVAAPANREELLEKLRTRARSVAKASVQTPDSGSERTA